MTKDEYIKRYGIDAYNNYLQSEREKCRELRKSEEYRAKQAEKSRIWHNAHYIHRPRRPKVRTAIPNYEKMKKLRQYGREEELEKIENYDLALKDNFIGWDLHHRLELTLNGEFAVFADTLKRLDMYYHRPYFELIFLPRSEHLKLHKLVGTHDHK